jgi:hypothetical protein
MMRREFSKRWRIARARVMEEINIRSRSGGMYARGFASEGYHAGYLQAMDDMDGMLHHGCPTDPHRFWVPEQSAPEPETSDVTRIGRTE